MNQNSEQIVLLKIQTELDRYVIEHDGPEEVLGFLHQHWARLLTNIFLLKGNQHADWLAGWDTVNALLWSLAPKASRLETEKMLHMLPTLLARLHEGCDAMSVATAERDALFERLALMHAAVARAGLRCREMPEAGITRLSQGAELDTVVDLTALNPPKNMPVEYEAPLIAGTPLPLPELKIGDHVHFRSPGPARELILNWISPAGGMYLFGNELGLDAMTLTRARLAERFSKGFASLVIG
jgi:hypothetical protein